MTEQPDLPSEEFQEEEVPEDVQDQAAVELDADDSPELRLQTLTAEYARERAALAEQISLLQEENDRLTRRVQTLEQAAEAEQDTAGLLPINDCHPKQSLGLDFFISEEQRKG